jgi:hypothetical protein
MADAAQNDTPSHPTVQPVPDGWVLLSEVFIWVTNIVGAPDVALDEIRRHLLAGRVRSLRRRRLDGGVEDVELARTFWRDIKLYADRDKRGREVVGMRLVKSIDSSAVSWGWFYLYGPDVQKVYPMGAAGETELVVRTEKPSRKRGSYKAAQRIRARAVLRRIFTDGDDPTEEELSSNDLWDQFCNEYDRVEAKAKSPSKYGMPSRDTVLREVGRR